MSSYYDVLGVNPSASDDEVRSAYLRRIRLVGPGSIQSGVNRAFAEIQKAYDTLGDPERREVYDAKHEASLHKKANGEGMRGFNPELAGKVVVDVEDQSWYSDEAASTELPMMARMNTDMSLMKKLSHREAGVVNSGITDPRRIWAGEQVAVMSRKFLSISGARIFWSVKPGHENSADAVVVVGKHAVVVWGRAQQSGKYHLNADSGMVARGSEELFSLSPYSSAVAKIRSLVRLDEVMGFVILLPAVAEQEVEVAAHTPDVRLVTAQNFATEAGAFLAHQAGGIYPKKFAPLYDKV